MSSGIVLHRDSLHPEMDFDKLKLGQKYSTEKFGLISCMLCMLHLALPWSTTKCCSGLKIGYGQKKRTMDRLPQDACQFLWVITHI